MPFLAVITRYIFLSEKSSMPSPTKKDIYVPGVRDLSKRIRERGVAFIAMSHRTTRLDSSTEDARDMITAFNFLCRRNIRISSRMTKPMSLFPLSCFAKTWNVYVACDNVSVIKRATAVVIFQRATKSRWQADYIETWNNRDAWHPWLPELFSAFFSPSNLLQNVSSTQRVSEYHITHRVEPEHTWKISPTLFLTATPSPSPDIYCTKTVLDMEMKTSNKRLRFSFDFGARRTKYEKETGADLDEYDKH